MQTIYLDISNKGVYPCIYAKQSDLGRKFNCILTDSGIKYEIPEGAIFSVWYSGKSGDGNYTKIDGRNAVSVSENIITIELISQMLNNAGEGNICFRIEDQNGLEIGSWNIPYEVEFVPGFGSVESEQYYPALTQAIIDATLSVMAQTAMCPAIEGNLSGGTLSMNDAAGLPFRDMKICGKTTQDGTPEPTDSLDDSYIPLINAGKNGNVGVSIYGKNLFNNDTSLIGQVSVTKSDGSTRNYFGRAVSLPAGTYTISARTASTNTIYLYGCTNKKDGTFGQQCDLWQNNTYKGPHTITVEDGDMLYFYEATGQGVEAVRNIFAVFDIQIEVGTSVTAFEPYKVPQTMIVNTPNGLCGIPVDKDGNYTDENGQQWVCDEIDLARGVYIKRIHTVDFSKGEWVEEFSDSLGEDGDFWGSIFRLSDNAQMVAAKEGMPVLCSHINWASGLSESAYTSDGINVHADYMIISLGDFPQEILEELAVSSVKVQYVMATPEEVPLSAEELEAYAALHANKPNTTVMNDGGAGMAVTYVADTKTYIDNKFNELANALYAISLGGYEQ